MTNKRIIIYLLAAFISGNVLLIYIQYNSYKNINNLINGNEKVLSEIDVINELRELKRDITLVEGRLDGRRRNLDSAQRQDLKARIKQVQTDIDQLQQISDDDSSVKYIDVLDPLIRERLFTDPGEMDSARLIPGPYGGTLPASGRARMLDDSIRLVTRIIENSRQRLLARATLSIDNSGKNALHFGTLLISVVLLSGAVLFWLIISTIRRQNLLIEQLNESEKRVKETALIKEKFMANMSHEIRTPLNAILGFTHLLQRKTLDQDSTIYTQTIQKSGEKLLTIINDILDLSKIEAGMMRIETAPFTLRGLVHSVEQMFNLTLLEKRIRIVTEIDATLPDVLEGDAARLSQILVNLISNAIKFTSHGTIDIKISNEGVNGSIVQTGIVVSDTGIGIEKNKLDHIFDRFQQAEDSVTRNFGGTGLGLSIVKELVNLQGGSISVESEEGSGSSFTVIIPYKISSVNDSNSDQPDTIVTAPNFGDVLVLVVEDNEINQSLIKYLFKSWGLNYDIAGNGKEALRKIGLRSYDLILMDIQMPEMDGYTVTREIRQTLNLTVPIIAMTAHALPGEREKCLSYGMNEYISKPIREIQLHNLIAQFTHARVRRHPATNPDSVSPGKMYRIIDLAYMQEVSGGNTEYEKTVSLEFITSVPEELKSIAHAWLHGDYIRVKQLAHNMKTTVSVMGLGDKLNSFLDALEYEDLQEVSFKRNFESLQFICEAAVVEARQFASTL